jgi:hypothetical protein
MAMYVTGFQAKSSQSHQLRLLCHHSHTSRFSNVYVSLTQNCFPFTVTPSADWTSHVNVAQHKASSHSTLEQLEVKKWVVPHSFIKLLEPPQHPVKI